MVAGEKSTLLIPMALLHCQLIFLEVGVLMSWVLAPREPMGENVAPNRRNCKILRTLQVDATSEQCSTGNLTDRSLTDITS